MEILNAGEYTGNIIQSLNFEDVIITNTIYSSKKSNPDWHYHENLHICFVFQGGKAETPHTTKYTQRDGSIFFYHSEEKHRWISPSPISKSANIEIGSTFLNDYQFQERNIKDTLEKKANAKTLILKMQREMLTSDEQSFASIKSLLLELISKEGALNVKCPPRWLIKLTELLHDNWDQQFSLTEIALILGVHPVTISKHFRKYFSCTLGEYRRKIKIEKSIDLIKHSNKTLTEIAFECGFSDQSHFIRNFKTLTGFLPKDFRNL